MTYIYRERRHKYILYISDTLDIKYVVKKNY
jgi:hypothetical protein